MHDVFRGGVEPGGLTADFEIKMLICYLLSVLDKPIPVSILLETFVKEGIGNYFEGHQLIIEDAPSVEWLILDYCYKPSQINVVSVPKLETLGEIYEPF